MSKARDLADFQGSASALTTGTLPVDRVPYVGRRNLIINGGFDVWQRGTSFSNAWNYGADRWVHPVAQSKGQSASEGSYSTFTCQGSSDGAYGFTSVELPATGSNYPFIVGQAVTLSFRVNSTSRVKPYFDFRNGVVGASNGFTTDSIEYKGGSGSWETVSWTVIVTATCGGSDNCLSISFGHEDASATVAMTQVQLELGSVATPFEHRSYGEELALCQRFYQRINGHVVPITAAVFDADSANIPVPLKVTMRSAPSFSYSSLSNIYLRTASGSSQTLASFYSIYSTTDYVQLEGNTNTSVLVAGDAAQFRINTDNWIAFDAEL